MGCSESKEVVVPEPAERVAPNPTPVQEEAATPAAPPRAELQPAVA